MKHQVKCERQGAEDTSAIDSVTQVIIRIATRYTEPEKRAIRQEYQFSAHDRRCSSLEPRGRKKNCVQKKTAEV